MPGTTTPNIILLRLSPGIQCWEVQQRPALPTAGSEGCASLPAAVRELLHSPCSAVPAACSYQSEGSRWFQGVGLPRCAWLASAWQTLCRQATNIQVKRSGTLHACNTWEGAQHSTRAELAPCRNS